MIEKRQRRTKLLQMFSLQDNLPAHYKLCIFNILLVILIFSVCVFAELGFDADSLRIKDDDGGEYAGGITGDALAWALPLIVQTTAIFMFTMPGCLYFITAYLFPMNRCCFRFGTVLIATALIFFFSTVLWSWWYFIAFFIVSAQHRSIWNNAPALFCFMIVVLILSIFNIGFVVWVVGHMVIQLVCKKCGLIKTQEELIKPIQVVNEDKRIVGVSSAQPSMLSVELAEGRLNALD